MLNEVQIALGMLHACTAVTLSIDSLYVKKREQRRDCLKTGSGPFSQRDWRPVQRPSGRINATCNVSTTTEEQSAKYDMIFWQQCRSNQHQIFKILTATKQRRRRSMDRATCSVKHSYKAPLLSSTTKHTSTLYLYRHKSFRGITRQIHPLQSTTHFKAQL